MRQNAFQAALAFTLPIEGGFQNDYNDPGNWTGGAVGSGRLVGTNFGISAASFPNLDIADLTLDQAKAIYQTRYFDAIDGNALPDLLAIVTFDAAVNSGTFQADKWLQRALGVPDDGDIGPVTLRAAQNASDMLQVATDAVAYRTIFLTGLSLWQTEPLGFARRVLRLAATLGAYRASAPDAAPPAV
jgi:lysozyme family protein